MSIFERLGLKEDASAEESVMAFTLEYPISCNACRKRTGKEECSHFDKTPCPMQEEWISLLAAIEQRGHEAGRREVWEKICPTCINRCHREPECCDALCMQKTNNGLPACVNDEEFCPGEDDVRAAFDTCPLVGRKDGA